MKLAKIDYEILNAASDDWELIDQIYISVKFDFIGAQRGREKGSINVWQERPTGGTLYEIATAIHRLVKSGLLNARHENSGVADSELTELTIPCWFKTTEQGMTILQSLDLT